MKIVDDLIFLVREREKNVENLRLDFLSGIEHRLLGSEAENSFLTISATQIKISIVFFFFF